MNCGEYDSLQMENFDSICYICDTETYELLHLTKAGMDACGLTNPEEYKGKKCYEVLQGLDVPCSFCANCQLKENQEYRWQHYNEKLERWFEVSGTLIQINGRNYRMGIAQDITAKKMEVSLLSGKLSMEDVLIRCLHTLSSESNPDAVLRLFLEAVAGYYQADRAYIFELDRERRFMENTFEWHSNEVPERIGSLRKLPLEMVQVWMKKFETVGAFYVSSLEDELRKDSVLYQELQKDGVHSLLAAPLLYKGMLVGFLGVNNPCQHHKDLTLLRSVSEFTQVELEKRRLMVELEYLSYTDILTGLYNRNHYNRALKRYETQTTNMLGVVLVSINGMKGINETRGHNFGDYIIRRAAAILRDDVFGNIFRIGGDEFVVLCEEIPRGEFREKIAKLRDAFAKEKEYKVSIGYAWKKKVEDVHNMLFQAEEMMNAEKQSFYHMILNEGRNTNYTSFVSEVAKEIEEGRFLVYYQPQVDLRTEKIIGAEALVRKRGDDGSLIMPNKFIPIYEMEGVISHVDLYVMRTACAAMRKWMDHNYSLHLSVNFSRVTLLEPNIVDVISGICKEYNVPTSVITIEVTESVSKMDNETLEELIKLINGAGFTISLDDFGSQYSNLAILAAMDFDEIKFDRSLVKALESNPKSRVVMENSVNMCRSLGDTSSLAEGVETKGQLELLKDYHCDYGQGFYFSKPLPWEKFDCILKEQACNKEP